jgi:hypothetical protein
MPCEKRKVVKLGGKGISVMTDVFPTPRAEKLMNKNR